MNTIELIDASSVRIGQRFYRLFTYDTELQDGTLYSVETYGRPYAATNVQERFSLDDLSGVKSSDLPNNFSFMAYEPLLDTPGLDCIYLKAVGGKQKLSGLLFRSYQEWTGSENLTDYLSRLAAHLRSSLPGCVSCTTQRDEYGVTLSFVTQIPANSDIAEYIRDTDALISRSILSMQNGAGASTAHPHLKPDEHGFRWWIRYVVVPLLGSATVVALVALARRAFN